jgi:hypothetical protein
LPIHEIHLPTYIRNQLLTIYLRSHLDDTRNSLMAPFAYDQTFGQVKVDISGATSLGLLLVKVSEEPPTKDMIEGFFEECSKLRAYESIIIAPVEKEEDRRAPPVLLYDNRMVVGWLRTRDIRRALAFVRDNFKFLLKVEDGAVYLVASPRLPSAKPR